MHIVVFPGWYPGRIDKLSGDFIRRHLYAISLQCRVSVVIPVKDATIKKAEEVKSTNGNLTELYYYYPSVSSIKWIDNLFSFIRYNYTCFAAFKALAAIEKVDLIHLYVLQKNQLIGLLLKWIYKIPYVVSEQSTRYVDGGWEQSSWLQRKLAQNAFRRAASFHAVSNYLLSAITNKLNLPPKGVVIPNVVDTNRFFYSRKAANSRVTFVHVSNMVYQKNVDGMLQAFSAVKKVYDHFLLNLIGPATAAITKQIEELGLSNHVVVWNERTYAEVAELMQQSNVFVFFTRFETFGCVTIEAHACGLPVIISDLQVTRELVTDHFNGLFVESENVQDLAAKISSLIDNPGTFDPVAISEHAKTRFNYERISRQFADWYLSVTAHKKGN